MFFGLIFFAALFYFGNFLFITGRLCRVQFGFHLLIPLVVKTGMRIRNGNGIFVTDYAATNAGSGVVDAGNALGSYNGHQYTIDFVDVAGQLNYTLTDVTAGTPASAPAPSQNGAAISFDSVNAVTISGTPQAGDQFTVAPSSSQSLFATLGRLITALETPKP